MRSSKPASSTPTLFIDGVVHRGGYDPPALLAALPHEPQPRQRGRRGAPITVIR